MRLADATMLMRALRDHSAREAGPAPAHGDPGGALPDPPGFAHPQVAAMLTMLASQPAAFPARRAAMVHDMRDAILRHAGGADSRQLERVLSAIQRVPRERFVPPAARASAYLPTAVKIGHGQTISAPLMVAVMTLAAETEAEADVLDVGTGSGYQAAILACLVRSVVSVEIVAPLAGQARRRLRDLGYDNVDVVRGDGALGVRARAPYDAIIVAAGAASIPDMLLDQLKPGGRLVMPIGVSASDEHLIVAHKHADLRVSVHTLGQARFVPLAGVGGRPDAPAVPAD